MKFQVAADFMACLINLVSQGDILISEHGYDELVADDIMVSDILAGVFSAQIVEYYPEYHKGPCVLVLQHDNDVNPVHVLWGIPAGALSPAVIITAYRPDPTRWNFEFLKRKPQ